jgi:hypothetical protein
MDGATAAGGRSCCLSSVAAASGAASVRVWHITSRGWDPWTERPLPEVVRVAYPLWQRRLGRPRPDLHAHQAIDSYVALNGSSWTSVDRAFGLIRALELARAVKDDERLATVVAACEKRARESMMASSPEPGVALRLVRALMWLPPDLQPASVEDLLAEAERVYGADPVSLREHRRSEGEPVTRLRVRPTTPSPRGTAVARTGQ